ncbi:carbamate kinase [bacterium]|nr:carbamate kinase [bacterium]
MTFPPSLLIALGGNAIVRPGEKGTVQEQLARTRESMGILAAALAREPAAKPKIVITHGNGPQVGDVMLRGELARTEMGPIPLDAAVADTQGFIGSMIALLLRDELARRGVPRDVVAVVTHVLVDPDDEAFEDPTKPIGAFYSSITQARRPGWVVKEFPPRGWRRVVASPSPTEVVERETIRGLHEAGAIVVCAGGGGIPVTRGKDGLLRGVEAVVDKDRTSALLAGDLGIDTLAVLTAVERVQIGYGTARAADLSRVTRAQLASYHAQGEFPPGSMGPKIESALAFLARGGRRVVITSEEKLQDGLDEKTGTIVLAGP